MDGNQKSNWTYICVNLPVWDIENIVECRYNAVQYCKI